MISSVSIEATLKQQAEQQQAEQWAGLQEHFANRHKPKLPDPADLVKQQADMEFHAGLERQRQANERALMDDLAKVFAHRREVNAAMPKA